MDNTETHSQVIDLMKELHAKGCSYHDISLALKNKFGLTYSDDNIR